MDKVQIHLKMVIRILELILKVSHEEMVNIVGQTVIRMPEVSKMD